MIPHVMTVTGPVPSSDLGITLTHEHVINDASSWAHRTSSRGWDPDDLASRPVSPDILWDLRHDPFANVDNCRLDNLDLACTELLRYAALGGRSLVEATGLGAGRDLRGLQEASERTGVQIVAGTGFYLHGSHPVDVAAMGAERVADLILRDIEAGESGVRPGIIGEIGVSAEFTPAERVSLHGALLAQVESGLPIEVHLPAWFRRGTEVLDLAEELGVDPAKVVLCHMGPSGPDHAYQEGLLRRGVWVQYDMTGMEVYYADQRVQCPSDEQNAAWITRLVRAGYGQQLLISHDVFLKSLLREHGGPGYGHILQYFVPRLLRHGLSPQEIDDLLIHNPRALFDGRTPAPAAQS